MVRHIPPPQPDILVKGGIAHNLPQEAPQAFAQAVADIDGFGPPRRFWRYIACNRKM